MALQAPSDLLFCTPQGTWRVVDTRVSLDSVIYAFWDGAAAEEICQDFPSLTLAQVYSVIAYYLTHRERVDAYLKEQKRTADEIRQELHNRHNDFLADLRRRSLIQRQSQSQ